MDNAQVVESAGIRFTPDEILEVDEGQVILRVAKGDVRRITLRNGWHSAHPFLQIAFGIILTAVGALPTYHFAHWLLRGGHFVVWVEGFLMSFILIGPWLVFDAFKRGPYLDVDTVAGRKRLVFDRSAEFTTLQRFVATAGPLGYAVDFDERLAA